MRIPNRPGRFVHAFQRKFTRRSERVLVALTTITLTVSFSLVHGQSGGDGTPRIRYVTSVSQLGPVAYRVPLGAISPDGQWLAYTAGTTLSLQRLAGGPGYNSRPCESR